jgi:hypothetical protein
MNTINCPEAAPLTPREVAVIEDADFFKPYQEELHELFVALGRAEFWSDDPERLCEYMEPAWLGGEHGNGKGKDQFTPEQEAAAWPLIHDMGFTRRIPPPAGSVVDDAAMVGATDPTNQVTANEFRVAREVYGVQTPTLRLWTGERFRAEGDGTTEEIVARMMQNGGMPAPGSAWLQHQLAVARGEIVGETAFATETDLGRLCLGTLVDGGNELDPTQVHLALTDLQDPHARLPERIAYTEDGEVRRLPARIFLDRDFATQDGLVITVMNAAAVQRERGLPRHTSNSCINEHIERYPLPQNGSLLLVGSQPYGIRVGQDVRYQLDAAGRSDVQLVLATAPMRPTMALHSALGNFASLTRLDIRRNNKRKG